MKITYYMTYLMIFVYTVGETARRGLGYFSVNATTMMEDYLCACMFIAAAFLWAKRHAMAGVMMVAAYGYSLGGMMVPFFGHLEAFIREETFRPDHPHTDLGSVILKGSIWLVSLVFFIISLRNMQTKT
jgi:hypothetical protein